jgi:hypothetical protein
MSVHIKLAREYWFRGRRVRVVKVTEKTFGRGQLVVLQDCETQAETQAYARHFREEAARTV